MTKSEIRRRQRELEHRLAEAVGNFQRETRCEVRAVTVVNDALRFGAPRLKRVRTEVVVDQSDTAR